MLKIDNITISNFKNIGYLSHKMEHKTAVLAGKNGRGKTAFKEALLAGITGEFPSSCITNGEDHSSVEIVLEDGTVFNRVLHATKANKVSVNSRGTTAKNLAEVLETKTGVGKDAMKIITSADVLEGMKPDQFGDFLVSYIPETLDYDNVLSYIPGITPAIEFELSMALPAMPAKFNVNRVKEACGYFVEQRKLVKKDISTREARTAGFNIAAPTRPIAQIEKDLSSIIGRDSGQASAKTAMNLYNLAVANRGKTEKSLAALKTQIDGMKATKPNPVEMKSLEDERDRCLKAKQDAMVMIRTLEDGLGIFRNTRANLDKPVCPLSEHLVCTTDKTKIKEELDETIRSYDSGLEMQKGIVADNETRIAAIEAKVKAYRDNELLYNKKVILNAQYETQRKNLAPLPPMPPSVTITDYSEIIKNLQKERDDAIAYSQYEKDVTEIEALKERLSVFNYLCGALAPKGDVMGAIMAYYMATFEAVCNKRAALLRPGFAIKFVSEDGVSYLARTSATGDFCSYSSLSSGEKMFVMFLLLDMLNVLSQLKIMILDDLDKLDKDSFAELMKLVQSDEVQDEYDNIIICTVDHDDVMETLKKYPNIDFVY